MKEIIAIIALIIIVGAALAYIIKEKRKGTRCIGCPYAGNCHSNGKNQCRK
ncbi:MAG: FeoB-associated Cys-rich membrane protein [Clostridiales bacterium]|nr:FeoB-associated Cys-rich membrane protein [Clostridiales bacterium]